MSLFDRFADWLADVWASAPWFMFCVAGVFLWLVLGPLVGWGNETWHLSLNSPTTALTFLGMYSLHNTQHRFEKAVNTRLVAIPKDLKIEDPVEDEGQIPSKV